MQAIDDTGTALGTNADEVTVVAVESSGERIAPRDIGTGVMRGSQTVVGGVESRVVVGNVPDQTDSFGLSSIDDDGVLRFLIGNYPGQGYKMKLSQTGVNVVEATDDQLVWSSDFKNFKIVDTDTFDFTITSVGSFFDTYTLEHNLDFQPYVLAGLEYGNVVVPIPTYLGGTGFSGGFVQFNGWVQVGSVTDTTADFEFTYAPAGTVNLTVRYYLLRETLV